MYIIKHKGFGQLLGFRNASIVLILTILSLVYASSSNVQALIEDNPQIVPIEEGTVQLFSFLDLNPKLGSEPEFTHSLDFKNRRTFSQNDPPVALLYNFKSLGNNGDVELIPTDEVYRYGASSWLSRPPVLSNLNKEASNIFDLTINIPNGQRPGAYTAALIFEDAAGQRLGYHFIIINVGLDKDLVAKSLKDAAGFESAKLEQGQVQINLINESLWHIHPLVELTLSKPGSPDKKFALKQTKAELGILPNTRQVFILPSQQQTELKRLIAEDWQAEVKVFCNQADYPKTTCLSLLPSQAVEAPQASITGGISDEAESSGFRIPWSTIFNYVFPIVAITGLIATLFFSLRFLKAWHQNRSAFDPQVKIKPLDSDNQNPDKPPPATSANPLVLNKPKPPPIPPASVIPDMPPVNEINEFE